MTIDNATFVVQRGDAQFSCLGSELGSKLLDDDLLVAQVGDTHVKFTGSQLESGPFAPEEFKKAIRENPTWFGMHIKDFTDSANGMSFVYSQTAYYKDGSTEDISSTKKVVGHEEFWVLFKPNMTGVQARISNTGGTWEFGKDWTLTDRLVIFRSGIYNCPDFNGDMTWWDTVNVTMLDYCFDGCRSFSQDLSEWCTTSVEDKDGFGRNSGLTPDQHPVWGTCPRGEDSKPPLEPPPVSLPDDALLVVTDEGNGHKSVTGAQVKTLFGPPPPPPWEGADAIYHVIITNPADIKVASHDKIYNKDTQAEVSSIDAAGEWIITGLNTSFQSSQGTWEFGDLTDTSNVTDMNRRFRNAVKFNGDLSGWDTSNVTDMSNMFQGAAEFNGDLSSWDTSNVEKMTSMFRDTGTFNGDISGWNTDKVTDMGYMFDNAKAFNQDLSSWNTSNVTRMLQMFFGATNFNGDITTWNTGNVMSMGQMFSEAKAFNRDIGRWDTSYVTNMDSMFNYASFFNQDLSGWCVTSFDSRNPPTGFAAASPLEGQLDKQPQWGTCPRGEDSKP